MWLKPVYLYSTYLVHSVPAPTRSILSHWFGSFGRGTAVLVALRVQDGSILVMSQDLEVWASWHNDPYEVSNSNVFFTKDGFTENWTEDMRNDLGGLKALARWELLGVDGSWNASRGRTGTNSLESSQTTLKKKAYSHIIPIRWYCILPRASFPFHPWGGANSTANLIYHHAVSFTRLDQRSKNSEILWSLIVCRAIQFM